MTKMDEKLAALSDMSTAQLHTEWQQAFNEPAPSLATSLLRRALAYHMQELAFGGLRLSIRRSLEAATSDPDALPDPPIQLTPGTRLTREWNGRLHTVLITDDGLEMDGHRYGSLSQVARAITGAHWSGPRFFGLKRRPAPPSQARPARG